MVEEIITRDGNGKEQVERIRVTISGKEMKLRFTMPMWYRMEDEICTLDDLYTMMHSKGRLHKDKIPLLCEIMSGGAITADDVMREEDTATIRTLIDAIEAEVAKAVTMKEKKYDDNSVHDEVLEEIEKKDQRAG